MTLKGWGGAEVDEKEWAMMDNHSSLIHHPIPLCHKDK